ncbi:MAG TPA: SRPBCC family protein [Caulobacter sp.]|nr:SRPBCC family protein [Caulobacter sp.]
MATIRIETDIAAPAGQVWDAIRDYGALHTRLVPGFVVDTRLEGDSRLVTFGNGMVARERIVGLDDDARRFAYAVVSERLVHHSASNQVLPDGEGGCRFVWIADVLPDAAVDSIAPMMRQGAAVLKATAEAAVR